MLHILEQTQTPSTSPHHPNMFLLHPNLPLVRVTNHLPTAVFLPLQKFRGPARIPRQVNGLYEDTKVAAHGAQIFRPGRPVSAAVLMWDEGLEERMGGRSEVR